MGTNSKDNKTYKKYLPAVVYGGSDGAVSYFSLMAGAYGAGLQLKMIIAIGLSNVFADAFSMASADYLSEDSKVTIDKKEEMISAVLTFFSFATLGLFPIIPTLYAYFKDTPDTHLSFPVFLISTILTIIAFSFIGYLRGRVLGRDKTRSILQSVFICSVSAILAYFVGEYVAKILI